MCVCVCVCVYTHTHTHTHTQAIEILQRQLLSPPTLFSLDRLDRPGDWRKELKSFEFSCNVCGREFLSSVLRDTHKCDPSLRLKIVWRMCEEMIQAIKCQCAANVLLMCC